LSIYLGILLNYLIKNPLRDLILLLRDVAAYAILKYKHTSLLARPVGGANQDGAQLVPLFNEDISSTEGQLFPQQSIVAHE
jgi:hypothetical protein